MGLIVAKGVLTTLTAGKLDNGTAWYKATLTHRHMQGNVIMGSTRVDLKLDAQGYKELTPYEGDEVLVRCSLDKNGKLLMDYVEQAYELVEVA